MNRFDENENTSSLNFCENKENYNYSNNNSLLNLTKGEKEILKDLPDFFFLNKFQNKKLEMPREYKTEENLDIDYNKIENYKKIITIKISINKNINSENSETEENFVINQKLQINKYSTLNDIISSSLEKFNDILRIKKFGFLLDRNYKHYDIKHTEEINGKFEYPLKSICNFFYI